MEQPRKPNVPSYLKKPFQSEYDRLNVDPTPPGVDYRTQKPATQNAPVRPFHGDGSTTMRRGRVVVEAAPAPAPVTKRPTPVHKPMPVQVGNHEEQVWFDEKTTGLANENYIDSEFVDNSNIVDNNEFMDVPGLDGHHNLVRVSDKEGPLFYCTICKIAQPVNKVWTFDCAPGTADDTSRWVGSGSAPETTTPEPEEELEELEEQKEFNLESVTEGSFVVLYENQIVYAGPDETTAKKAVETVLLQYNQPPTSSIVVLRRLSVDFGISFV